MVLKIIGGLVALVLLLLGYASTRPDSFRVERSATIKAPPDKVFANLQDFKLWANWSPWEKLDPAMARTFSPATTGKGAHYTWAGDKVGAGRMEFLEVTPSSQLKIKLDFTQPFEAHNVVDFTLKPQGDTTQVTWAMSGPSNLMVKVMHIFMSMDGIVGKDFEKGLADLKAVSEK